MEPDRDAILKALEQVVDPELKRPVTELDMVRDVVVDGGRVTVTIAVRSSGEPGQGPTVRRVHFTNSA